MSEELKAAVERLERSLKDKIRFAAGQRGRRYSTVWSAWASKGDYYIGARSILGSIKISLHESGICRVALTDLQFRLLVERGIRTAGSDRKFVKWRRAPSPATNAVLVACIVFPIRHLHHSEPVGEPKKPLIIFETLGSEGAAHVGFFYSREPPTVTEQRLIGTGRKPWFRTQLDTGEVVTMATWEGPFDPKVLPTPEQLANVGGELLNPDAFSGGAELTGLDAMIWNAPPDDGTLVMIEVGGIMLKRNSPSS